MNFAVSAGDERLEVTQDLGREGDGGEAREISGGFLVKEMEAAQLRQIHAPLRIVFDALQLRLQLIPDRPLGGDELCDIDDHMSCRCFTRRYCATTSEVRRA